MAEGGGGATTSGLGTIGGIISSLQAWFGGHGAGSGRSASRAMQQINLAAYRLQVTQAAITRRRFEESLQGRYYGPDVLQPIVVPDLPPVRLTTRQTNAQQAVIRAAATPGQRDDRSARHAEAATSAAIAKWQKKHPQAYSIQYVTHR